MTAGTVEKVYRLSDSRLTPVTGAVLAYYAYRAYYMDGRCAWPSLATVASACFCDEKTVRRALTRLCELGYMRVNPDQSWNARNPETGQLVRRGYRSKVYDVLIENFETLADEGRTERAREHAEHHRAEEPVNDARQTGQNVHPDETPMISTVSQTGQNVRSGKSGGNKVDIVSPRTGQNVHLPTSNQQSSPAPTGHPPTNRDEATDSGGRKQRSTTPLIRRQSVPESTAHDVGGGDGANDVLDALARMRSALGLETPEPTRRDRQAVGSLLERVRKRDTGGEWALAEDEMLRVVAWMPSNTFWLRRVMTGRALAANWPDIVNDYAVDL
ncbi:MAG: helix-turn-helix domain-containing protein, partial [Bifidobacterium boum]|nr:helix-turn-helix domain-containing protein [Bifidobacterium boum]